jgi:hypothetical protein
MTLVPAIRAKPSLNKRESEYKLSPGSHYWADFQFASFVGARWFFWQMIQGVPRRGSMLKLMFVDSIALATFTACEASAQGICPLNGTPSHNLVCVLVGVSYSF